MSQIFKTCRQLVSIVHGFESARSPMQANAAALSSIAQRAPSCTAGAHDELFALLYADLHRLARREMARHGPQVAISPTTLLHEAYLNMQHRGGLAFPDQWRFLAYAARAMRGVAIDRARERARLKRGGDITITSFDTENAERYEQPEQLPRISEALDELALLEPELAHLVDLKFFCGFTLAEIAALKNVSERTVQRHWEKARLMLYRALSED
jgi:RNA polymerase sigma factor (TIGR02999 family)